MEEYNKIKLLIIFFQSNEEIKTTDEAKEIYKNLKDKESEKQEAIITLKIYKESENDDDNGEEQKDDKEKITYINYAQLKTELIEKNNEIKKNLEIQKQRLENLVGQDKKKVNLKGKGKKFYNLDNIILVFILLIGLVVGANFACGYNRIFKK